MKLRKRSCVWLLAAHTLSLLCLQVSSSPNLIALISQLNMGRQKKKTTPIHLEEELRAGLHVTGEACAPVSRIYLRRRPSTALGLTDEGRGRRRPPLLCHLRLK